MRPGVPWTSTCRGVVLQDVGTLADFKTAGRLNLVQQGRACNVLKPKGPDGRKDSIESM